MLRVGALHGEAAIIADRDRFYQSLAGKKPHRGRVRPDRRPDGTDKLTTHLSFAATYVDTVLTGWMLNLAFVVFLGRDTDAMKDLDMRLRDAEDAL